MLTHRMMLALFGWGIAAGACLDVGPAIDGGASPDPGPKDAATVDASADVRRESGASLDASDADASENFLDAGGPDADPTATLSARSPDCLTCAEAYCSNILEVCVAGGGA